ncbi:hypothetical protein B0O80DRAFT_190740 [Mortierella sp. GBAus27b]|nr:hypothetical protein B0O80DRAFT_190740 [Mortierella sp. GBAus27b]
MTLVTAVAAASVFIVVTRSRLLGDSLFYLSYRCISSSRHCRHSVEGTCQSLSSTRTSRHCWKPYHRTPRE